MPWSDELSLVLWGHAGSVPRLVGSGLLEMVENADSLPNRLSDSCRQTSFLFNVTLVHGTAARATGWQTG